ncbi:MAG: GDSL-type esterase/lipase family protein [Firmicutes bacterium]|nr:GDSL-type esterase/lipase family protein [Bacillota bacterium]
MAGERKRIEEIQMRKQERERAVKHKIYLIRRAAVILAAAAAVLALVFGVKSIVNSIQQKKAEEAMRIAAEAAAEEAAKPTPTPEPRIDENGINQTFYDNTAFVGNSFVEGITIYELLENCDYFSKVGLSINQVTSVSTATGSVPIIEELNAGKQYAKIFLMFGENEVGWIGDAFFEQYQTVIDTVRSYQPSAGIYILAVTPISQKVSEQDVDGLNIENIKTYNEKLKALAEQNGAVFADIFTPFVQEDGYLAADAATDGIHFGEDYYIEMLKIIQSS